MSEGFVPASRLYDIESRTPIAIRPIKQPMLMFAAPPKSERSVPTANASSGTRFER
ncbi:hypothetical protein [Natrialba asiatica]|uniref:hypothetical protein n=1 Tax=Natrialba asiatica TaxID=64602 RepID=UPI0014614AE0|nr:hypothetical protein [Natrialba asiatica]